MTLADAHARGRFASFSRSPVVLLQQRLGSSPFPTPAIQSMVAVPPVGIADLYSLYLAEYRIMFWFRVFTCTDMEP